MKFIVSSVVDHYTKKPINLERINTFFKDFEGGGEPSIRFVFNGYHQSWSYAKVQDRDNDFDVLMKQYVSLIWKSDN
jgi:hypothetical protein